MTASGGTAQERPQGGASLAAAADRPVTLLYFAWLRARIGKGQDSLTLSPRIATVQDLIAALAARGGGYADALADLSAVRVAVNQEFAELSHPVRPGDEIALFPPVTGG